LRRFVLFLVMASVRDHDLICLNKIYIKISDTQALNRVLNDAQGVRASKTEIDKTSPFESSLW